jgi:hypothetical protein
MTPKKLYNLRLDDELLEGLETIRRRDGDWSVSRQIREAVRDWLHKHGVDVRTGPKPGRTKKRKTATELDALHDAGVDLSAQMDDTKVRRGHAARRTTKTGRTKRR